jgi:uncharacterized protein (TIGR03435 family)
MRIKTSFSSVVIACLSILIISAVVHAQAPTLAFEVASIKPAEQITPAMIAAGKLHVGMSVDPGRVDIGYLSLGELVPIAFKVKPYQVSGPDWLRQQRWDINAKMPEGATKDDVPAMLKALIEERFQMKARLERRDSPVYALVVGKDGPKLKDAPPDTDPAAADAAGGGTLGTGGSQLRVNAGRGGATMVSAAGGTTKITPGPDGTMRMELSKLSMAQFADMLTPLLDRPVMDMTDLKGNYQISLDLTLDTLANVARAAGLGVPGLGARGGDAARPAEASDPGSSSIFNSVQQLGLKLESRRAPVDFVVIDHIEKAPTDN